jgi:hypothetical protein
LILVSRFHTLTVHSFLSSYMFLPNVAIIRFEYMFEDIALGLGWPHWAETCGSKETMNCECVKVTDKNQYNTPGCYTIEIETKLN